VFGSLGKLGEWRPTNELNKAYVEEKKKEKKKREDGQMPGGWPPGAWGWPVPGWRAICTIYGTTPPMQ
jgi:hypothetical protein